MSNDIQEWVTENRELLATTLRHSEDPYIRACALVLLRHGGSERDKEAVKREVEEVC